MSTNVGIWSPNELILPTVEPDLDYKFFFVTEPGSIEGLDISFNSGDWLIYIKKDGVGNWYKSNGGIISFNTSSSANAPDPGYYTRVRLDNNGNIIDADYITKDDLPKHTHSIDDIIGDWETKIKSYIGGMFQSHSDSSVQFTYDKSTQTITAEVNIDNDTITQNEWGELTANGGGNGNSGSATTISGKIAINQVEDLSNKLLAIDANIQKNFIVCNSESGLQAKYTDDGTFLSVKIDGTSLVLNADGELSVSSNVLLGGSTDGSDLSCGAHTHTTSQITDFEEAVKDLIKNNAKVTLTDLPIDNQTIIINSNGQLSCVAAGTRAHTHTISDITDLNPKIANVWASQQGLQNDEDYSNGALELTGRTIGYSVKVINEYIKNLDNRLSIVENKINTVIAPEPNSLDFANIELSYNDKREVYDKDSFNPIIAGFGATFTTDYFYPAKSGKIDIYIDNSLMYTQEINEDTGLLANQSFEILGIRDSYYDNAMYRGNFESMQIKYTASNLSEGYHTFYMIHTVNGDIHQSRNVDFQIYVPSNPTIILDNLILPENNTYVSGVPCYNGDGKIRFTPRLLGAFTSQFVNGTVYQYSDDNGITWRTPDIFAVDNTSIYFEPIEIYAKSTGSFKVLERAFNVLGALKESNFSTSSLLWNTTDVEQYRVVHGRDFDGQSPSEIGGQVLSDYNPKNKVPQYEMVIQNNIGSLVRTDYKNLNGPDYSNQNTDKNGFVWCNFKFNAPFMNNLHINIVHKDGTPFEKNSNGSLNGLQLYVAQSDTNSSAVWVNGNNPYPGYGKADSVSSPGLDLFKSDNKTRYITFGQRPDISVGYLYIKVGVTSNIDLGDLVESVKESINEWS